MLVESGLDRRGVTTDENSGRDNSIGLLYPEVEADSRDPLDREKNKGNNKKNSHVRCGWESRTFRTRQEFGGHTYGTSGSSFRKRMVQSFDN